MTHTARGLDSDGALLLDVAVSGYVLQLQSSADVNVKVKPHTEMTALQSYFSFYAFLFLSILIYLAINSA